MLSVADVWRSTTSNDTNSAKSVYYSDIDFDMKTMMQEFSISNEVYFGWHSYHIVCIAAMKEYVQNKESRKGPSKPTFENLLEVDNFFSALYQSYVVVRDYNAWLWWWPFWKTDRETDEENKKNLVYTYLEKKVKEYEEAKEKRRVFEESIDNLMTKIEEAAILVPPNSENVSVLLSLAK